MTRKPKIWAYYYPSWHNDPRLGSSFYSEWDIVRSARPGFQGHQQPRVPLWGYSDLSDRRAVLRQVTAAKAHGLAGFIICLYWDHGELVYDTPLWHLVSICRKERFGLGVMWVNRRPHSALPLAAKDMRDRGEEPIFRDRRVQSGRGTLRELARFCCEEIWSPLGKDVCLSLEGRPALSIFSVEQLLDDLGEGVADEIGDLKEVTSQRVGSRAYLLGTVHRPTWWLGSAKQLGFDGITSYVLLPEWDGQFVQFYERGAQRAEELWSSFEKDSKLPYVPSVCVGWDSSPRGKEESDGGHTIYPWSPIIVEDSPEAFERHLGNASGFASDRGHSKVFVASWNEWSEGHYLEPDTERGCDMLAAVARVANRYPNECHAAQSIGENRGRRI